MKKSKSKKLKEQLDDLYDHCYECGGYGDDYSYNPITDELDCNCPCCYTQHEIEVLRKLIMEYEQ